MRTNTRTSEPPSFVRSAARRASRWSALAAALLALGAQGAVAAPQAAPVGARYWAPLPRAQVVAVFDAAATTYGPGHRGTDLQAAPGDLVMAAADGVVTFAGSVVDRGVVVMQHRDGIRTTYEPVDPRVASGESVMRGQIIAVIAGTHRGRHDVLHWGARRGDAYVDPMRLIHPLGLARLVLAR